MRTVRDILFNIAEEAYDDGLNDQYEQSVDLDQALEDTRKAIKDLIGGK